MKKQDTVESEQVSQVLPEAETAEASSSPISNIESEFGDVVFLEQDSPTEEWPVQEYAPLTEAISKTTEDAGPVRGDFFADDGNWHATVIGQTPGGKNVQVMKDPASAFYMIAFNPGGELPVELQGRFTSYDRAELHARIWLNTQYAKAASAKAKS
jgi:hypothetical protein